MGKLSGRSFCCLANGTAFRPAMADVFANSGAEVLFSATECFV